jgi:hypothetical protein
MVCSPRAENDGAGRNRRAAPAVGLQAGRRRTGRFREQAAGRFALRAGRVAAGRRRRPRAARFIGCGAGLLGAHADATESQRSTPWPDGLRGRARVWASAGLGRAAAYAGNEGARANFQGWARPN